MVLVFCRGAFSVCARLGTMYQRKMSGYQITEDLKMRVSIEDTCTACGLCVDTCPEVFEMGPDIAQVKAQTVEPQYEEAVQQAADECPVEAIIVE